MIRRADAQEWHIQHAPTSAPGVIIPTVDDVDRARKPSSGRAIHPSPPQRRPGQAAALWASMASHYRQTVNDNAVVIMIETPTGVANAYDIASVPASTS